MSTLGVPVYSYIEFETRNGLSAPKTYWMASEKMKFANCNGCGTSGWRGLLVPDTCWGLPLTEACNIHDWCYSEGKEPQDKTTADTKFFLNLLALVDNAAATSLTGRLLGPLRRWRCWHYYEAVRYAGDKPFLDSVLIKVD